MNAADRGTHNQDYFHQHFLSDGHNGLMNDCEIIFIDKMGPSDSKSEFFWMRVIKTIASLGLNIVKPLIRGHPKQWTPPNNGKKLEDRTKLAQIP